MPYIGHSPEVAQRRYESIDDISGSFNGSTTSFALQVGGVTPAPFPVASENVLISVGGVIQEPDGGGTNGFQLTGTNIVFSSAPASGQSFFGVILAGADYVTAGHAFPDGDLASPSITFASDLDTGLFRPDSGALAFGGNGSEHARLDGSGRFLVGTSTGSGEPIAAFQGRSNDASDSGIVAITRTGTNPSGSIGELRFATGSDFNKYYGMIICQSDGSTSSTSLPGVLRFSTTASSATSPTERMRITSTGKIGVGEINPQQFVHVSDEGSSNVVTTRIQQSTTNTSTDGGSLLELGGTRSDGTYGFYGGIKGGRRNSAADNKGYLAFLSDNNDGQSLAERMRLDDGGRLLINTTSAITSASGANFQIQATSEAPQIILGRNDSTATPGETLGIISYYGNDGGSYQECASIRAVVEAAHANDDKPTRLIFAVCPDNSATLTERLRIQSDGLLRAFSANSVIHSYSGSAAGTSKNLYWGGHSATNVEGAGSTNSFVVRTNGNVQNTNNSYSSLSDVKLKENIVDAASQWEDIKGIRVRKYNFKEETGHETFTQIGVIAQEVETVSPGLVIEVPDSETVQVPVLDENGEAVLDENGEAFVTTEERDLETTTKSVNYSVLYMKAVKALQEAQTRIETLETQNAAQQTTINALLTRVTALEST